MTMVPTVAWYVAYGSNISHDRFARYLETDRFDDRVASATNRWLSLDRRDISRGRQPHGAVPSHSSR